MLNVLAAQLGEAAPVSTNSYESIATVTVGSGGAANIDFTGIPSTYKHLQIRLFGQFNRATYGREGTGIRVGNGSIDTGNSYSWHALDGDGSSASASAGSSTNTIEGPFLGTTTGGSYGGIVIDVLDYANTSKLKTIRALGGLDHNGTVAGYGGMVSLRSGLWQNAAAINQIRIYGVNGDSFTQYSQAALYGIKG